MTLTGTVPALVGSTLVTEPSPGFLAAALAAVGGAALLAFALARSNAPRRPTAGPADPNPAGPEPPALAGMLAADFEAPAEAVPATVVDLAARGRLRLEDVGGGRLLVRLGGGAGGSGPGEELTAYERRVLRHVEGRAVDGVVPATALTTGDEATAERWFEGFRREVHRDARRRGLARPRWSLPALGVLWLAVVGAYAAVALAFATGDRVPASEADGGPLPAVAVLGSTALGAWAAWTTRAGRQRDTDAGLAAASRWLGTRRGLDEQGAFADVGPAAVAIWDRHLAYATAFGLAPAVERALPSGQERDRRAWSNAGGRWRRVRVRYPRLRPGWGTHPFAALAGGLVQAAVAGAVGAVGFAVGTGRVDSVADLDTTARLWVERGGMLVGVVLVPVVAFTAAKAVLGLVDLFPRRTVEGLVVRRRAFREGHWLPRPVRWLWYQRRDPHSGLRSAREVRHWLAIDDGSGATVRAYRVRPQIHGAVRQGAQARLRVSPRLGYVTEAEMTAPPPGGEALPPSQLTEQVVGAVGDRVERRIDDAEAARRAAGVDRAEGPSVLDREGDDGRTGREQLAEARRRLAGTGVGGLLDGVLDRAEELLDAVPDPEAPPPGEDRGGSLPD